MRMRREVHMHNAESGSGRTGALEVLYVFPEPLPLPRARGVQVAHTVAALGEAGASVSFAYVPAADGADPFDAYGLKRPANVELVPLPRNLPFPLSSLPVHSNRLFFWRLSRWLRARAAQGRRPQIVMVRHLKVAYSLLQAFPDLPLLYEAHEVFANVAPERKRPALAAVEEMVLRRAAVLVAITQGAVEDLKRRYGLAREAHVLHDAVALPASVPAKAWHEAGRHVVYAGSFFVWKGVQDLVTAAKYLPGCRITLIGGSPEQIAAFTAELDPAGAEVVFAGHLRHDDVMRALGEACIAVLPNREEPNSLWSSPLKLFEYMGSGCAVVASDLPSFHEVLGADDAVWTRPGDGESLAQGILRLTCDAALAAALGQRMRDRVRDYTWERRADRLLTIMSSALRVGRGEPTHG
jgi:glycosyltransferase involved in cell wall biosynthesis